MASCWSEGEKSGSMAAVTAAGQTRRLGGVLPAEQVQDYAGRTAETDRRLCQGATVA